MKNLTTMFVTVLSVSLFAVSTAHSQGVIPLRPGVSCNTFGSTTTCSDGTSYNTFGNTTTSSDGVSCNTFGGTTTCSNGVTCSTFGGTTTCN